VSRFRRNFFNGFLMLKKSMNSSPATISKLSVDFNFFYIHFLGTEIKIRVLPQ
jgi:hypothetical protein